MILLKNRSTLVVSVVEKRAEADRIAAIAFRRDIGPAPFHGEPSDPVRVIAKVSKLVCSPPQHPHGAPARIRRDGSRRPACWKAAVSSQVLIRLPDLQYLEARESRDLSVVRPKNGAGKPHRKNHPAQSGRPPERNYTIQSYRQPAFWTQ
ncbi:hypothetical protein ACVMHR_010126 [Bradyrhizobium diazoefficiens]